MSEQEVPAPAQLGVENLKKLVMLVVELGNVGDQMGRLKGVARFSPLMNLYDEAMALAGVDLKAALAELKDLDSVERAALHRDVCAKFDIADDNLEGAIEACFGIVEKAFSLYSDSVAVARMFKKQA